MVLRNLKSGTGTSQTCLCFQKKRLQVCREDILTSSKTFNFLNQYNNFSGRFPALVTLTECQKCWKGTSSDAIKY